MTALLRIGTKVRTIDRGARVHGRAPDKPEAIGVIRDHFRPFGRQSKDRAPPYYVTFESGESAWYDASEVEPMRGSRSSHATKKSPAQLEREIDEVLSRKGGQLRHHSTITKASPRSKKRTPRCGWIPDEDAYEVARDFAFNWTTGGAIKQACIPAISIRSSPIEDVPAFNSLVKASGDPTTARKVPPLVVERARTGTDYRIVDGRHRLAAANKHGFARVPVIIVEGGG